MSFGLAVDGALTGGGILDWCFLLDGSKACKTHIQRTGGLQVRLESARLVVQEKLAQSITAVL